MPTWSLNDGDINENNENDCTLENGKWYCKRSKCKSKHVRFMSERERQSVRNKIISFKKSKGYRIRNISQGSEEYKKIYAFRRNETQFDPGCDYCTQEDKCLRLEMNDKIYFGEEEVKTVGNVSFAHHNILEYNTYYVKNSNSRDLRSIYLSNHVGVITTIDNDRIFVQVQALETISMYTTRFDFHTCPHKVIYV